MRLHPGIVVAALLGLSCTQYHSISSISDSWLEVKMDLYAMNFDQAEFSLTDFEKHLHGFRATLNSFFSSPVAHLYEVNRPVDMQFLGAISLALDDLKEAAKEGSNQALIAAVLEIDSLIGQMQLIDTDFSNESQLQYFQLFFFFSLLVIGLILALGGLFSGLRKARAKEQQSRAFSRETVLALEHERERIARELHDTVAQDLWRLNFQVEQIDKAVDPPTRNLLCREVIGEQKEIMQKIREICNSLIPPGFKHRGLENALRSLCHDFQQRSGIICLVKAAENLKLNSLDMDRQLQIFRIVQECLSNIQKHSGAGEASVLISAVDSTLVITVCDNGKGFTVPGSYTVLHGEGKLGLWSMRERAAYLAGNLSLNSSDDGTMVTLELPLGEIV